MNITAAQVCRKYKVSRTGLRYWRAHLGFPQPNPLKSSGNRTVFDLEEVEAWYKAFSRRKSRRNAHVRRSFERCGTIAETARRHHLSPKTVRTIINSGGNR